MEPRQPRGAASVEESIVKAADHRSSYGVPHARRGTVQQQQGRNGSIGTPGRGFFNEKTCAACPSFAVNRTVQSPRGAVLSVTMCSPYHSGSSHGFHKINQGCICTERNLVRSGMVDYHLHHLGLSPHSQPPCPYPETAKGATEREEMDEALRRPTFRGLCEAAGELGGIPAKSKPTSKHTLRGQGSCELAAPCHVVSCAEY